MLTKQQKFVCILCAFVLISVKANAQNHSEKKWYALAQTGFVFNNELKLQPAIAAGKAYKGYGFGVAASMDFFAVRSYQLSLDLRKTFTLAKQDFFVYANPGFNIVMPSTKDKNQYYSNHQFKDGKYIEAGAGILFGKNKNLLTAFYWSRKYFKESYSASIWNPILSQIEQTTIRNKYEANRLGIKLGYIF